MFEVVGGSAVRDSHVRSKEEMSCWLAHPLDWTKLVLIGSEYAKMFLWQDFKQLGEPMRVNDQLSTARRRWTFGGSHLRTRAFATQDGRYVVSSTGHPTGWSISAQCVFWPKSLFDAENDTDDEAVLIEGVNISTLVGVWRNRAVFLDIELWVRSKGCLEEGNGAHHFLILYEWLSTPEEGPLLLWKPASLFIPIRGSLSSCGRG
jgi:hypothetical protein